MDPTALAAELSFDIDALPRRDTPTLRALRRRWSKRLKAESGADVLGQARALELASGQGGKWVAYELIRFHPAAFARD